MLQGRLWSLNFDSAPRCMDDVALVTGLQRGDARAVEYVVQQYAPALYRFAYYQLQDSTAAEDLVSEVMARIIGRIDGFKLEQATFQAWVFRIARNLIADYYRSRKRKPQVSLDMMLENEPENEPRRHDLEIDNILDRDQLRDGLAALTDEQRQVILLHVVEGWELPQVARLLDRTIPSVKSLYYRGVQSLRHALTRAGDGPNEALG
jgi:RNA polymerase sigma-70 factor (ECF subfamily)